MNAAAARTALGELAGGLASWARPAVRRLRERVWPITQTSVAAGLAWYIAHVVLGHPNPFFAPVAAAVCLSASNVLRGQRAVQMVGGVTLGIAIGIGIDALLGANTAAVAVAAFVALSVAVLLARGIIAQGLMFYNQAAASAILIIALPSPANRFERLFDALIGGAIALIFSLVLFPADPVSGLRGPSHDVLAALSDTLENLDTRVNDPKPVKNTRTLDVADRINDALVALAMARDTAHQIVRTTPHRRGFRPAVAAAEQRAIALTVLADAVLTLTHITATALSESEPVPPPLRDAFTHLGRALAALTANGPGDGAAAVAHAATAAHLAGDTQLGAATRGLLIASLIIVCARDIPAVADTSTPVK
jgi:uncharacterized membrane protein YgaE (UPF0421/DUF939 family)